MTTIYVVRMCQLDQQGDKLLAAFAYRPLAEKYQEALEEGNPLESRYEWYEVAEVELLA